ncbi:hypothetical protein [Candidatus Mycoplasma haematohominis]|uniref:hypothetical protein n=1 Tax=Candidatus Mycoplasma haematohominis TaxID=1494318 RepID=UPI001C0A741D|nr:hypothetical protein [Candidatus Mycoplasma haemohominis]
MKLPTFVLGSLVFVIGTGALVVNKFLSSRLKSSVLRSNLSSLLVVPDAPASKEIQNTNEGTFGHNLKYHFVDAEDAANDLWWNWSYQYRYLPSKRMQYVELEFASNSFRNVASFSALKDACKSFYSKAIKSFDFEKADKSFNEYDVWMYCSIDGFSPVTLEDDLDWKVACDYEEGEIEEDDVLFFWERCSQMKEDRREKLFSFIQETSLVSTNSFNDLFWEKQAKGFFASGDNKWEGIGKKAKLDEAGFKDIFSSTKKEEQTKEALKKKCRENYEKKPEEFEKVLNEVVMFCSLRGASSLGDES